MRGDTPEMALDAHAYPRFTLRHLIIFLTERSSGLRARPFVYIFMGRYCTHTHTQAHAHIIILFPYSTAVLMS